MPWIAASVGLFGLGCNEVSSLGPGICNRSPEDNPAVLYTEGTAEGGIYMSSPWEGQLLWWPGGMRYRMVHYLGAEPRLVQGYLGFEPEGLSGTVTEPSDGALALASGNQLELLSVDDEAVVVRNGTCSDFWLLVVATADLP